MHYLVLSFNHPEITARCIRSVQTAGISDSSIHLVHNGSTEKHSQLLETQFKNINHIKIRQNQGFANGANIGLNSVFQKTNWVCFLTNDTTIYQIGNTPVLSGLYAPLIYARKTKFIDSFGAMFFPNIAKLTHRRSTTIEPLRDGIEYVPGTAFIIDKDTFTRTKGFDETLGTYWEDVDFSVRLKNSGGHLFYDDRWKVIHQIGKTCHKNPHYTSYLYQRNKIIVSNRYANSKVKLRIKLVSHLMTSLYSNTRRLDFNRNLLLLKAYWDGFNQIESNKS
jgi:GT2 family glycosyltransferase